MEKKILAIHLGEKKVILRFEDEKLSIHPNTYTELRLYPNKVLTDEDFKEIKYLDELDEHLNYAKKLLAKTPKSEADIKERLAKRGANKKQTKAVIESLKKYHLLDDGAYLNELLELYEYKCYGKNKIIESLKKKGVSSSMIASLHFSEKKEYDKASKVLPSCEKKFGKYNFASKKEHAYAYLLRYGFDMEVARATVELLKPGDYKYEMEKLEKDYKATYIRYMRKYRKEEIHEKVTNYLLGKGYRYNDIKKVRGKIK
ncbi:MAG: recombination regulator RecX [Bacilli bacterium]|nr:recombination regulator RecX [Bacilli bacterium]